GQDLLLGARDLYGPERAREVRLDALGRGCGEASRCDLLAGVDLLADGQAVQSLEARDGIGHLRAPRDGGQLGEVAREQRGAGSADGDVTRRDQHADRLTLRSDVLAVARSVG